MPVTRAARAQPTNLLRLRADASVRLLLGSSSSARAWARPASLSLWRMALLRFSDRLAANVRCWDCARRENAFQCVVAQGRPDSAVCAIGGRSCVDSLRAMAQAVSGGPRARDSPRTRQTRLVLEVLWRLSQRPRDPQTHPIPGTQGLVAAGWARPPVRPLCELEPPRLLRGLWSNPPLLASQCPQASSARPPGPGHGPGQPTGGMGHASDAGQRCPPSLPKPATPSPEPAWPPLGTPAWARGC